MSVETIGYVRADSLIALERWMRSEKLERATHSSYAPNRLEKWYRWASNLRDPKNGGEIYKVEDAPERIIALGDKLLPGWHSILLCGGDTKINWHRDHSHFEDVAVMINIGVARYYEWEHNCSPVEYALSDGQVVKINTKVVHMADPTTADRMNLTFRRIKSQYINATIPLF